jgi:putative transcriptional regulator
MTTCGGLRGVPCWDAMPRLPSYRVRTGRFGRTAFVCGVLMIAGPLAALLVERARAARQPGPNVIVGQLAPGTLLVATRRLPDPNFAETVVLLLQYSRDGAAGLVLNRPSGVALSRALPGVEAVAGLSAPAFIGGPVSPETVLALSRAACEDCRTVARDVHLVNAAETLKRLAADGTDTRRLRVFVGYSGWRGGQLEEEVRRAAWRVVPADARSVFDPDPASLWERMLARAESVLATAGQVRRRRWTVPGLPRSSTGYHPCSSPPPHCRLSNREP